MSGSFHDTIFQKYLCTYNGILRSYDPFSEIRADGLKIPESLRERLLNEGRKYLDEPYAPLYAHDYMAFVRTGNRSDFEQKYFSRRHHLCAVVTAYLADGSDDLLNDIIDGIYCIGEESTWALPAHNSYIRDTRQLILPDTSRPVLDLFACETAALLSTVYYLLREQLDDVSELICKNIFDLIESRLVRPYLEDHFWWMGNGDEPMCNWTPWCTQNVLLSVFLLPFNDDIRFKAIKQSAYSLDCFLKDYGEDGCCDEGAQYYRHAGLCLFHCIDILNTVTNNALRDLFSISKIKNIASYIVNVHACGEYYINFSDCAARAGRMGVREFLFGKACKLDALMYASSEDFYYDTNERDPFEDESQKLNLYLRVLTAASSKEVLQFHENMAGKASPVPDDIYYPSVGLMVARSSRFVLAAKSGDNADNHNHNDTGSFILYMDGQPVFVDVGVETYSQKTFSDRRYDIWTMQSGFHNLPTINGIDQKAGRKYRATDVNCDLNGEIKNISMHIEDAYPLQDKDSDNKYYIRKITLDASSETVILTDISDYDDVILNFITYEEIRATDDPGIFKLGNAGICFDGASVMANETLPITDARLRLSWDHDLYRIRLKKKAPEFTMTVSPLDQM